MSQGKKAMKNNQIIFYATPQGNIKVEVVFEDETFWLSQKRIADLFSVDVRTINEHLQNIYDTGELQKDSTVRNFRIVQKEGSRDVTRNVDFYRLDAIIAVGYRVNSAQATQFRIWATNTLKEFITKGFVLDDERLKQGKPFGKDYFDELLNALGKYGQASVGSIKRLQTCMRLALITIINMKQPKVFSHQCKTSCIGQ